MKQEGCSRLAPGHGTGMSSLAWPHEQILPESEHHVLASKLSAKVLAHRHVL